jgi:tRNA threonylcarbamoyladenosine biosynthesis protein TsaB
MVMNRLLVIDTSTEACSVALAIDADVIEVTEIIPRQHTHRIMPMITQVLAQADVSIKQLDAIAFGRGPGAFTGLRIAAGVVQGLAFGANLPVIPISTLAALAQGAWREFKTDYVVSAIDARMSEVYWACYQQQDGLMQLIGNEQISSPPSVTVDGVLADVQWLGVGTGCEFQTQFQLTMTESYVDRYPKAVDMLPLAQDLFARGLVMSAQEAIPVYLRDSVAQKPQTKSLFLE